MIKRTFSLLQAGKNPRFGAGNDKERFSPAGGGKKEKAPRFGAGNDKKRFPPSEEEKRERIGQTAAET